MRAGLRLLASALVFGFAPLAGATVHDQLFKGTFDVPPDAPTSTSDAARFLTQATFGPTAADIAYLMAQGRSEWIDEQLSKPATLGEPVVEAVSNARTAGGQNVGSNQRLNRWFWQAVYAPDQLRQRMAYALSQIFVVSDQSSSIGSTYMVPLTQYGDMLAQSAFLPYGQVLLNVTYHPMMGRYLNAFRNVKATFVGGVQTTSPDENYAREVMQLFSIGLIMRNPDFSPVLTNPLDPESTVPTYDQNVITQTAKAFTGFTWSDAPKGSGPPNYSGANFYTGGSNFAAQYAPMACWGTELFPATGTGSNNMRHDITVKTVLGDGGVGTNNTIPANQTCAQDLTDELAIIATHPNVAPFISRQLIQRFVTSNPSPAYIGRISAVFNKPGNDLGDVLKAILTDPEAENPPALCSGTNCDSYGKLREPVLRLTELWRAFNAKAPAPDQYGEVWMLGYGNFLGNFGQAPLESPTVFNFYLPDYQQPGVFADGNLFSPELQITNESTTYSTANVYYQFTQNAYQGMTNPRTDRPLIDLSSLTVNATNPTAMVATINAALFYGSMSTTMQTTLKNMLSYLNGASAQEKAWSAIYVAMLSPEFAVQR
ncbi:MAG: DUF1800 domain-containing protein [Proteobacteria bacterium]|nr:DUF1800 domain-containing protein [Pseudomonadota bacterium]